MCHPHQVLYHVSLRHCLVCSTVTQTEINISSNRMACRSVAFSLLHLRYQRFYQTTPNASTKQHLTSNRMACRNIPSFKPITFALPMLVPNNT